MRFTTQTQFNVTVRPVHSRRPWRRFRWTVSRRTFTIDSNGQGLPGLDETYEVEHGYAMTHARAWAVGKRKRDARQRRHLAFRVWFAKEMARHEEQRKAKEQADD